MNPLPPNNPNPINLPPIIITPSIDHLDDWDWNESDKDEIKEEGE